MEQQGKNDIKHPDLTQCPFGILSQKFHHSQGRPIDLQAARQASLDIRRVVNFFADRLPALISRRTPISIKRFTDIASASHQTHNNTPSCLEDIYPIAKERSAEYIMESHGESEEPLIRVLLRIHEHEYQGMQSHKQTAKKVMQILKNTLEGKGGEWADDIMDAFGNPDISQITKNFSNALKNGITISQALYTELIQYRSLQERFESTAVINSVNEFIAQRPDLLEDILGIQSGLTESIHRYMNDDPERLLSLRAFSEVAIRPDDGSEQLILSRLCRHLLCFMRESSVRGDFHVIHKALTRRSVGFNQGYL